MRFGIALNLKRLAATQYRNFDFNSMCVFNGVPLAAGDSIFSLDGDKDNGTNIDSHIEFPTTDFGELTAKRFRKLYFGYETSGSLKITTTTDDETTDSSVLTPKKKRQYQHRDTLSMTRSQKGVYWGLKIENQHGCDFSLDNIEGLPVVLTRGR